MVGASTSKGEKCLLCSRRILELVSQAQQRFVLAEHCHHIEKTRGCRPPGERRSKRLSHLAELDSDRLRMLAHDRLHALRRPFGNGVELCIEAGKARTAVREEARRFLVRMQRALGIEVIGAVEKLHERFGAL